MSAEPRRVSDFEGIWALARQITHADGTRAAFDGQAVWSSCPNGLAYHETGQLRIEGAAPVTAERRYFWSDDGRVHFEDGRFFHQVPLAGGSTAHWCDPDQYDVDYDFTRWPLFSVTWRVTGPRKAYTLISHYAPSA